jgi:hypothetical protein
MLQVRRRLSSNPENMCTLRAAGSAFEVDEFLASSPIEPLVVYHVGDLRFRTQPDGPRLSRSGFNADVSTKEWSDLKGQIEDAKDFLKNHGAELRRLGAFPGCEGVELDFPMNLRIGTNDIVVQSDTFPADLLLLAGTCGVAITFTLYPPSSD